MDVVNYEDIATTKLFTPDTRPFPDLMFDVFTVQATVSVKELTCQQ